MRRRRNPEIIAGRVNADGSIAAGDGFTIAKEAGAGSYTIMFSVGFRVVGFTLSFLSSNTGYYGVTNERTISVQTVSAPGGGGVNIPFSFVAAGVQQ